MTGTKDIIKSALYHLRLYELLRRVRAPEENRLLILMYHDVAEDGARENPSGVWDKPTRSEFSLHLKLLKKYYRVMTVEDAVVELKTLGRLVEPTAAITFDDGYESTFSTAYPVLREHRLTATVYLPTNWIKGRLAPWWLVLRDMVKRCDRKRLGTGNMRALERAVGISLGDIARQAVDIAEKKRLLLERIRSTLEFASEERMKQVLAGVRKHLFGKGAYRPEVELPMTWEQVGEMAAAGNRFGAHTMSHINVGLADPARAEAEIVGSKREIESRIRQQVTGFAYPYGKDVKAYGNLRPILEKNGFDYAVTAYSGNNPPDWDIYQMRRVTLPSTTSRGLVGRELIIDYLVDNE